MPSPPAPGMARILGVDPGLSATGWGIINASSIDPVFEVSGVITTSGKERFSARLLKIYESLQNVIDVHSPGVLAIEKTIFVRNTQIALSLGHARGILLLLAAQRRISMAEYTPKEIKLAIAGNGNASKEQVQRMVQSILHLPRRPDPDDVADAIAVALCHMHRMKNAELMQAGGAGG